MSSEKTPPTAPVDAVVMRDIPQEWIRKYVDKLMDVAKTLQPHSAMQASLLNRADVVMDLVKAFRESA